MNIEELKWRVHTPDLLREVAQNDNMATIGVPLQILMNLLLMVGQRATELDDPKLHELMIRLTLYTVADPHHVEYDREVINDYLYKSHIE